MTEPTRPAAKIDFNVEARRSFRAERLLPDGEGVSGYARAMADLTEAAASVAAFEGRMVVHLSFAVERVPGGGSALRLVANGVAKRVEKTTLAYRGIGGTP